MHRRSRSHALRARARITFAFSPAPSQRRTFAFNEKRLPPGSRSCLEHVVFYFEPTIDAPTMRAYRGKAERAYRELRSNARMSPSNACCGRGIVTIHARKTFAAKRCERRKIEQGNHCLRLLSLLRFMRLLAAKPRGDCERLRGIHPPMKRVNAPSAH